MNDDSIATHMYWHVFICATDRPKKKKKKKKEKKKKKKKKKKDDTEESQKTHTSNSQRITENTHIKKHREITEKNTQH